MKRFHPAPHPQALPDKALKQVNETRFMPLAARRITLRIAASLGMDEDAESSLKRLLALAETRKTCVAGRFMPDDAVSARLADHGIREQVDEADFFRFQRIAIPYSGISPRLRREWEEAGHVLEDFSAPQVKRAQVALGLLRMEGAQGLVIGRHDDPETLAITGGSMGIRIIEDTTDTARLAFAPAFGVVCQTTLSPRKVSWLVQQLRFRYADARVTFLETIAPSIAAREEALETILLACDLVVIVGRPEEASCAALAETALRRGKNAVIIASPEDLKAADLAGNPRVALTAGAFSPMETIRAVAEELTRM